LEYSEINTDFIASKKTEYIPSSDKKSMNFLTINAQSSFRWQIQSIIQELVWNDTDVAFISETGLTEENLREPNITIVAERNGYRYGKI
jgi:hypothetical protein